MIDFFKDAGGFIEETVTVTATFEEHVNAYSSIHVLKQEIEIIKTMIKPSATGHLHTAISVMEDRIKAHQEVLDTELEFIPELGDK
jgi:hypothetical protein